MSEPKRWSDDKLSEFHAEFLKHMATEEDERMQQQKIYDALFQKQDKDTNTPPGVVQLLGQIDARLEAMEISNDRQKRFVGGVMFAFSCIGFLFTDGAHKLFTWVRGL